MDALQKTGPDEWSSSLMDALHGPRSNMMNGNWFWLNLTATCSSLGQSGISCQSGPIFRTIFLTNSPLYFL